MWDAYAVSMHACALSMHNMQIKSGSTLDADILHTGSLQLRPHQFEIEYLFLRELEYEKTTGVVRGENSESLEN